LSIKMGRLRATKVASVTGQIVAVFFIIYAVINGEIMLGLIGVFVFLTASTEYKNVLMEHKLSSLTLADVLRSDYTVFSEYDPADKVLEHYQHSLENHFLVANQFGHISGVLNEGAILNYKNNKPEEPIQAWQLMHSNWEAVNHDMPLTDALQLMNLKSYAIIPVYQQDELVGVIDQSSIQKALS
jgi:predicted transcriptional regulator